MKIFSVLFLSIIFTMTAFGSADSETEFFHQAGDKVHILQIEYDYLSLDLDGTNTTVFEIKTKDADLYFEYEYGLLPMLSIFGKIGMVNGEVKSISSGSTTTTKTSGVTDLYLGVKGFHGINDKFTLRFGAELLLPWADRELDSSGNYNGHGGKTDLEAYFGADFKITPTLRTGAVAMTSLYSSKRSTKATATATTTEDEPGHVLSLVAFIESPMDAFLWGFSYANEHSGEGKNSAGAVDASAQTIQKISAYANIHAGNMFSIAPKISYLSLSKERLGTATYNDANGIAANVKFRFHF